MAYTYLNGILNITGGQEDLHGIPDARSVNETRYKVHTLQRIEISNGAIGNLDPEEGVYIITETSAAGTGQPIWVKDGGTLNIGEIVTNDSGTTQTETKGTSLTFIGNQTTDWMSSMIGVDGGGTLNVYGATIQTQGNIFLRKDAIVRGKNVEIVGKGTQTKTIRILSSDIIIDGMTTSNMLLVFYRQATIRNIRTWNNSLTHSSRNLAAVVFYGPNTNYSGIEGSATTDIFNGTHVAENLFVSDKLVTVVDGARLELRNAQRGVDAKLWLYTTNFPISRRQGFVFATKDFQLTCTTLNLTLLEGVKVRIRDYDNGNRLNLNGDDNRADKVFYGISNASGIVEGNITTIIWNLYNATLGSVQKDIRGKNNDEALLFDANLYHYRYRPVTLTIECAGPDRVNQNGVFLIDPLITTTDSDDINDWNSIDNTNAFYDAAKKFNYDGYEDHGERVSVNKIGDTIVTNKNININPVPTTLQGQPAYRFSATTSTLVGNDITSSIAITPTTVTNGTQLSISQRSASESILPSYNAINFAPTNTRQYLKLDLSSIPDNTNVVFSFIMNNEATSGCPVLFSIANDLTDSNLPGQGHLKVSDHLFDNSGTKASTVATTSSGNNANFVLGATELLGGSVSNRIIFVTGEFCICDGKKNIADLKVRIRSLTGDTLDIYYERTITINANLTGNKPNAVWKFLNIGGEPFMEQSNPTSINGWVSDIVLITANDVFTEAQLRALVSPDEVLALFDPLETDPFYMPTDSTINIYSNNYTGNFELNSTTSVIIDDDVVFSGTIIDSRGDSVLTFPGVDEWWVFDSDIRRTYNISPSATGSTNEQYRFLYRSGMVFYLRIRSGNSFFNHNVTPTKTGLTEVNFTEVLQLRNLTLSINESVSRINLLPTADDISNIDVIVWEGNVTITTLGSSALGAYLGTNPLGQITQVGAVPKLQSAKWVGGNMTLIFTEVGDLLHHNLTVIAGVRFDFSDATVVVSTFGGVISKEYTWTTTETVENATTLGIKIVRKLEDDIIITPPQSISGSSGGGEGYL